MTLLNNKYLTMKYPSSGVYKSYDIIPYALNSFDPNGLTRPENRDKDFGVNLSKGTLNYIYTRASNDNNSGPITNKIKLYWSKATVLQHPKDWYELYPGGIGDVKMVAHNGGRNEIVLCSEPFLWFPIDTEHTCLIAMLLEENEESILPDNLSDIGYNDLSTFIINSHGQLAWRNVNIVDSGEYQFVSNVMLEGDPDEQVSITLELDCKDLPSGTKVFFTCRTPGATPNIEFSRTISGNFKQQFDYVLDAGFSSYVEYGASSKIPFADGQEVTLTNHYKILEIHSLAQKALNHPQAKSIGIKQLADKHVLIPLGAHTTRVQKLIMP